MAVRKRRRKGKRKTFPKALRAVIFVAVCLTVAGILFYLFPSILRGSKAAYEEAPGKSSELSAKISRVDLIIYESLYKGKVEEGDIDFSGVAAGSGSKNDWEFTELSVKVSDQKSALRLGAIIESALTKLKPDVVVKRDGASQSGIVYNVYSFGHYTHRIRLIYKESWEKPSGGLPKIAIVIDDVGNDYNLAEAVMKINLPLTLSILPSSRYGRDIAEKARAKGFEVIMHLPMEPKDYPNVNPGSDALLTKMNEEEIRTIIDQDLKKIPGVRGINNHMGSYFTERQDKMTLVLRELKKRDLFYLDSRTTSNSVGFKLAETMGVPSAEKNVFIDNDLSSRALKYQLDRLMGTARHSGEAVGIGHPHEATINALKDYERVLRRNFKVVPVSELMK
jgi:uncharacterized protein